MLKSYIINYDYHSIKELNLFRTPVGHMNGEGMEILGDQYDQSQTLMMDEEVIVVDQDDEQIGSMSKVKSHLGEGTLHRAFSVLLFNSEGKLLIQKRASTKITFPLDLDFHSTDFDNIKAVLLFLFLSFLLCCFRLTG